MEGNQYHYVAGQNLKDLLIQHDLTNAPVCRMNKVDGEDEFDPTTAFLGPNIWDSKALADFKLEYMDLNEFLEDNNMSPSVERQLKERINQTTSTKSNSPAQVVTTFRNSQAGASLHVGATSPISSNVSTEGYSLDDSSNSSIPVKKRKKVLKKKDGKRRFTNSELELASVPGQRFDPVNHCFSEDELKPQPMVKKSQKQFVPEGLKDDRYWARRKKNNIAAKRSREARRVKENQIVLRASYLEKENNALKDELAKLKETNQILEKRLSSLSA